MEEYIIIGLIIVLVLMLLVFVIYIIKNNKSNNNSNIDVRIRELEELVIKSNDKESISNTISIKNLEQQKAFNKDLMMFEDKIMQNLDVKFQIMNQKLYDRVDNSYKKNDDVYKQIIERISHIDSAQKNIEKINGSIKSLESIFNDKKQRGVFGEISMYQILSNVFGDNDLLWRKQYKYSTGVISDAVIFAPNPIGKLALDAKFPLENYRRYIETDKTSENYQKIKTKFKIDLRHHISDIEEKYIINGETSQNAIMFIPSEAIFAEMNTNFLDVIEYATKRHVWITSPTTLIAFLNNLEMMLINIERDKYAAEIARELENLKIEFVRYDARWQKLFKDINNLAEHANDMEITTTKITKKFNDISNVNIEREKE